MDIHEVRRLGRIASGANRTRKAIERYLADPAICLGCELIIPLREGMRPGATKKLKFCSQSCAATANNKLHIKRHKQGKCLVCDVPVSSSLKYCGDSCRQKNKWKKLNLKIKEAKAEGRNLSLAVVQCRQRIKRRALEYMGGKCIKCGYDKSPRALHFHHVNPKEKAFGIGSANRAWELIKTELDKCVLLCSNCHCELHDDMWKLDEIDSKSFYPVAQLAELSAVTGMVVGSTPTGIAIM